MRRLLVIRHGKSLRDPCYATDFERPLAPRGKKAASRMARWILEQQHVPDLIMSSPAVRARQTAELLAEGLEGVEVWEDASIYEADIDDLNAVVRGLPEDMETIILVGHNFGLEYLVDELTGMTDTILKTCSLAVLEYQGESWLNIRAGDCRRSSLVHPRELTG